MKAIDTDMATAQNWHAEKTLLDGRNSDDYHLIEPLEDVALFDPQIIWSPSVVDYASHPAYRAFVKSPRLSDRLAAYAIFVRSIALLLTKRLINYELIPLDVRSAPGIGGKLSFAFAALKSAFTRRSVGTGDTARSDIAQRLVRDGIAVIALPSDRFFSLETASTQYFADLAHRRGSSNVGDRAFDESRASVGRQSASALFSVIEQVLEESGILAAAEIYKGRKCQLVDVNPQINDISDSFWRDIFPDLNLETLPRTAYCHRDASGGDLKAIIYMTDVGPNNGPFSFAIGSHQLSVSRIDDWIGESNDMSGLSGTEPSARRKFAALPAKLRQKCAYGNDLVDSSPVADALDKSLWPITASKGALVLFDTKGTHRGGMVVEGERRVITCIIG